MKHPVLKSEPRKVLGKKVKQLRRKGFMPANVYGKDLPSTAVQVTYADFEKVFKAAGETGLVDLEVDGKSRPVLIKNLQMNYQTRTPLHADFFQVNLKEKVKAMIPIILEGEPQAVSEKVGILLQTMSEVEIEALPADLPERIAIDVTPLAAIDDHITISDLPVPSGVTLLSEAGQTVAKIVEMTVEEPEEEEVVAPEGEEGAEETGEATNEEAGETSESSEETKEE